ncbi:TfoX/Sxy family protein [Sphingobacterium sp. HMA12]|uniref:TfoX/Sxy family protein n=1 Tax=Sphingobacterium sp. HMA12 TaxID=2050894 RepID=UPI000CEA58EF|nr:TfoX/Sxy family protein [Sphingobacterium sp. HMA12]
MAYNNELVNRVRERLSMEDHMEVEEKRMFSGLSFLVNGKMCVNISQDNLMCRYNPELEDEVSEKKGFLPMIMKGKQLKGYCYVESSGYQKSDDFEYWIKICLDYNPAAKASKKKIAKSRFKETKN